MDKPTERQMITAIECGKYNCLNSIDFGWYEGGSFRKMRCCNLKHIALDSDGQCQDRTKHIAFGDQLLDRIEVADSICNKIQSLGIVVSFIEDGGIKFSPDDKLNEADMKDLRMCYTEFYVMIKERMDG